MKWIARLISLSFILLLCAALPSLAADPRPIWVTEECPGETDIYLTPGPVLVVDLVVDTDPDGTVTVYDSTNPDHSASGRCGSLCLSSGKTGACHPGGTGPLAELEISCAGSDYKLKTGNDDGNCTTELSQSGSVTSASCDDGAGNSATATCASGCTGSSGSGSCTKD